MNTRKEMVLRDLKVVLGNAEFEQDDSSGLSMWAPVKNDGSQ
jgi:hypothetical protein